MRGWSAKVLLVILLIAVTAPAAARAQGYISDPSAVYEFGKNIKFQAAMHTDQSVKLPLIYFQEQGNPRTYIKLATISPQVGPTYQLEYLLDLSEIPLRAFSPIEYHFEVTLRSGEVITSSTESLDYIDNRFNWQTQAEQPFQVHWYKGGLSFAQKTLDAAESGLQRIQALLPLPSTDQVDIYIYPNSADMQETLLLAGQTWVAGHADPDLGVIVVTLPPGPEQQLLTEQRIPHELMHVLLYRSLGAGYNNLPAWLNEGLASTAELIQNPDYDILLDAVYPKDQLIPMAYLCKNFPRDASEALLSYAQSASFVTYLYKTFGRDGLEALVNQYAHGVDCESGTQNALGVSLTQLEQRWRQARFGENTALIAFKKLLPWLALMAAVLVAPISLTLGWLRRRSARSGKTFSKN
jgi:hypothetical protein